MVVALRNGKTLEPKVVEVEGEPAKEEENQSTVEISAPKKVDVEKSEKVKSKLMNSDKLTPSFDVDTIPQKIFPIQAKVPSPLYPQRLQQHKQKQELDITMPLVEALEQMPNYVKFMKDILPNKKRLIEFEFVALTKECSVFLQNKLPSTEEPPKLELKILPSHLKYVYLGNSSTLPVIVSVELTEHQEE
ncbi:Aspartic peptidase [Gossypium australe]|uniref:Aspartic peptidase n=1 Tax=Gossypium australe TaxID=47621 RepID=A0A5B6W7T7_9ROSI|nr:Aspartic peptidase [Gossypium australe]